MRIQFINPLLGGDFSSLDIAITSLATYLNEKTKHKAAIIDMTFNTRKWQEHLRGNIEKFKPDVIAMSCNTMYMQYVRKIAQEIQDKYKLPIVLGGYHASIHPEDTITVPGTIAVCIGDGEFVLAELLDRLEKGKSLKGLNGMWVKEKGVIIKNERGSFTRNLDDFPIPNWDLWEDIEKYFYYLGMLYIIGTRGCPYRCTYCDAHGISQSVKGPYYRVRDPRAYAKEIAYQWKRYESKGMRLAQLFDQVLTFDKAWLKEFCEEYRSLLDVNKYKFSAFSRIDNLDEEKIDILSKSGCALLRVGIEAGDDFIRNKIYRKNIKDEQIKNIFKLCKQKGIGFTAFYILGGPAETRKTINTTINLARELDAERSAFFIYKPFTDEGVKQIKEYGGSIDEHLWRAADNITFDAVVKLKDLTPKQVEWLQRKAYFYTFGRRLLRMLARQHIFYFTRLITYMSKGLIDGLDYHYLMPYYHIYGYDNVKR